MNGHSCERAFDRAVNVSVVVSSGITPNVIDTALNALGLVFGCVLICLICLCV